MSDPAAIAAADLPAPDEDELVVVVGPTASGKTSLAVSLAERWDGEVIVADSVQVYRGFDIGSGKPTANERGRAPHHLLDAFDAHEPIDAARFGELAEIAIAEVRARKRVPVVCGGTFLWVRAMLYGLAEGAPKDETIRARHRAEVAEHGPTFLHEKLALVDPAAATKLHPNDVLRTSRALEVFELTGRPLTDVQADHGFAQPKRKFRLVGISHDMVALTARIEARIDGWLAEGWIDEVRALIAAGYADARPMASIGYRQLSEYVQRGGDLAATRTEIVRATRTLVRRQRTWLRDEPVRWLVPFGLVRDLRAAES